MWFFGKYITIVTLVFSVVLAYPFYHWRYPGIIKDVFWGWSLALINIVFGYWAIRWAFHKSNKEFLTIILGSIGLRMLFISLMIVFSILFFNVSLPAFIFTFVLFYIGYLIVELKFIYGLNKEFAG